MSLLAFADPDQILQTLSNDLMSPYCPGRTIASCPSPQARKLEDHIRAEAEAGKSREEIEAALVARFGEDIRGYEAQPLLLYGSALVGLLALVALVIAGRRWARKPAAAGVGAAAVGVGAAGVAAAAAPNLPPSQAELDRLEDALDEVDEL
jgi:cytochrome c-type biogenesis protein CcmH/NrfF